MPVRGQKNPFPPKGEKGDKMFAACKSPAGKHTDILSYAKTVRQPQHPTRKPTKTLSR